MSVALGSHNEYLAQHAEELGPLAERSLPALRRPLAAQIRKHRAFLVENVRSDPFYALSLCGVTVDRANPGQLVWTAESSRDRWMEALDRLAVALDRSERGAVRGMLTALADAMAKSVAICSELLSKEREPNPVDLATVIDGDTAFRLNRYLLEMIERSLNRAKPQTVLAVRTR